MPTAIAIPGKPHAARRPSPSGMQMTKPTSRERDERLAACPATNTSGNVTANPTHATIHGER